jgi:hypothetical protein
MRNCAAQAISTPFLPIRTGYPFRFHGVYLGFTDRREAARVRNGFAGMVAAGLMGGGVATATLLGTGVAGRDTTRTVLQQPTRAVVVSRKRR